MRYGYGKWLGDEDMVLIKGFCLDFNSIYIIDIVILKEMG